MIVDTSVLIAILEGEPGSSELIELLSHTTCRISAGSLLEASIVADSRSPRHGEILDELIAAFELSVEPVTAEQTQVARMAYRRFGRGSGSLARLNFGDCFSYALATLAGEPLAFVGDDFGHTDVLPARAEAG